MREKLKKKDEKEKEMLDGWGCRDSGRDTQRQGKESFEFSITFTFFCKNTNACLGAAHHI